MIRKFRRIFRSPSTSTTIKNETNHQTSSLDSTSDDTLHNKQGSSSVTNRLYTGSKPKEKKIIISLYVIVYMYTYIFLVLDLIEIIHQGEFVFFCVYRIHSSFFLYEFLVIFICIICLFFRMTHS